MLKDNMIQILDDNRDRIKNFFNIDDNEINNIKEFLNVKRDDFKIVVEDMSKSNLSDRGKMALCCVVGYINGIVNSNLLKTEKYDNKNKEKNKKKTAR